MVQYISICRRLLNCLPQYISFKDSFHSSPVPAEHLAPELEFLFPRKLGVDMTEFKPMTCKQKWYMQYPKSLQPKDMLLAWLGMVRTLGPETEGQN